MSQFGRMNEALGKSEQSSLACIVCDAIVGSPKVCAGCGRATYCCREHQKIHWASVHKIQCKMWQEEKRCSHCGVEPKTNENLLLCGGCKVHRYCSSQCQKDAWGGGHRSECKKLRAEAEAAGVVAPRDGTEKKKKKKKKRRKKEKKEKRKDNA